MDQNSALQMMQMVTGGVVAQSISVATELGIADELADGGKSSSQLTPLGGLLRSAGARMFGRISAAFPHMTENVRTRKCAYSLDLESQLSKT